MHRLPFWARVLCNRFALVVVALLLCPAAALATPASLRIVTEDPQDSITILRRDQADIRLDGVVDEPVWAELVGYDNMLVMEPDTFAEPAYSTVAKLFYTNEGLYVSAVMEQPIDTLVQRLSARDEYINRDSFGITLDTSGRGLYGYWYYVNLGGSKQDGKVAPERSFTDQWDGAWIGETAVTATGWSAELFIPWSIMTMPSNPGERTFSFWINRKVAHVDERYGWPALPFSSARFMSALQPMQVDGVDPRQQWEIFPYASSTGDEIIDEVESRAGVDVFWRPSTNLQVTATANPDFGAVESDDVVVNLTAFETYFPEKRLFFLEGTEVFVTSSRSNPYTGGSSGSGGRRPPLTFTPEPTTLLNTRRIGGAAKHVDVPDDVSVSGVNQSKPTDLIGAAKIVGQAGGVRYGLLSAFEKEVEWLGTRLADGAETTVTADGVDYGVARALYEDSSGPGRRSIGYMGTLAAYPGYDAMVHGVDTHWLSASGRVTWDTQVIASDVDDVTGYGVFTDLRWTPKRGYSHRISIDAFDDELDVSDMGFLRRNDLVGMSYSFFHSVSQGLPSWLRDRRMGYFASAQRNTDGYLTRAYLSAFGTWVLQNNSEIRSELSYLPQAYDDRNSRGNGLYRTDPGYFWFVSYGTDSARPLSASVQAGVRSEDIGGIQFFADVGFTYTPVDRFSVDFDFRYKRREGWLLYVGDTNFTTFDAIDIQPSLSVDFFITAKQQLRMTFQWAGINADEDEFWAVPARPGDLVSRAKDPLASPDDFTISRLTAQLRYRWEIGPLSDLFVVYTRGSNLPNRVDDDFDSLFEDAFNNPIVDVVVMKLRYRFGS
jgi:hypothetical protein